MRDGGESAAMDKRSRERFEQILVDRREELHRRLNAARRHPREAGLLEAKDEGDRAAASAAAEMSEAQRNQFESLLRVITAALPTN